jgi:hypothetical protein
MTAVKMIAFLLLGIGAFLVYGARFVAARLEEGKMDKETAGSPEKNVATSELTKPMTEDEEKIMEKMPSRTILNVKMAGMVFILAGAILVLVAFK